MKPSPREELQKYDMLRPEEKNVSDPLAPSWHVTNREAKWNKDVMCPEVILAL